MGIFANPLRRWLRQWGLNAFFAFVVAGRWASPADRDTFEAQLTIFCSRCFVSGTDDLQHSLKFTYWYHQRNLTIYRLNGIKNTGVIVANKDTLVMIGDLSFHGVLLGI